jgi:3-oxoadipate enol-lactonase
VDKYVIRCLGVCLLLGSLIAAPGVQGQDTKPYSGEIKSGFVNVEDGKMFYEIAGDGDWLVLIHDGLVHREVWNGQFLEFAKKYKVVRYDRRGYGKSDTPRKPFSNVADLNRIFEELGIDKAILIGMSAGGGLAIDFTLQYPDRVTTLILVGAVVSGFEYTPHFFSRGGHISLDVYQNDSLFADYFLRKDPYEIYSGNTEAREKLIRLIEENPQDLNRANNQFSQPPAQTAINRLDEIKIPALVVVGEYDIADCHAHAGAIDAGIPDSYRIIVSDTGHLVPLERPEEFNELVFRFINESRFFSVMNVLGIDKAIEYYNKEKKADKTAAIFSENRVNNTAYGLLFAGSVDDAVKLFHLNTLAYPESWNAFDSYGEALLARGDTVQAIENYEKSIAINPENKNGLEVLGRIKK